MKKFKFDSLGYHITDKGKRVNINNYRISHDAWEDSEGNPYREDGTPIFRGEKIVGKWSKKHNEVTK